MTDFSWLRGLSYVLSNFLLLLFSEKGSHLSLQYAMMLDEMENASNSSSKKLNKGLDLSYPV